MATPVAPAGPPGVRVMSFNIRFANPGDGANRWEFRKETVAKVLDGQAVEADGPVLVTGDFNEASGGPATGAFSEAYGWSDAGAGIANGEYVTSNGWRMEGPIAPINFIFARRAGIVSASVLRPRTPGGGWASDHFPVAATVVWKPVP